MTHPSEKAAPDTQTCPDCAAENPLSAEICKQCGAELGAAMQQMSLIAEFWLFLKQEKKWWMIPMIAVLLIIGGFLVFASSSPLAPFLYPLF